MRLINVMLLLFLFTQFTRAQIYVTPQHWDEEHIRVRPNHRPNVNKLYTIDAVEVDATIKDQIAEVSVTQTVSNPNDYGMEVQILFPLPGDGVIENFILMVDGEEIKGDILPKDEARSIYEGIVRRKRDPALMEYVGYGLYKTSIFPVGVGQSRKISMRYTQVIKKKLGNMQFSYPIGTLKFSTRPIPKVSVTARIRTSKDIKAVYSPSSETKIDKINERFTIVKYEISNAKPSTDFKLNYTLSDNEVGASLYSYQQKNEKGYFMFVASPKVEVKETKKTPKNIYFVLDQSGSMSGKKIEQSKAALEFVLSNLNEDDYFKIISYNDRVEAYKNQLEKYSPNSYKAASAYVKTITSGGGTNIEGALKQTLEGIKNDGRPNYVIFLTDGKATAGITDENAIVQNVEKYNTSNARIFCFGVGNSVNARLLDRLSTNHGGMAEYVRPDEDIEIAVSSLFKHISNPVMTDIKISFRDVQVRELYPVQIPDLFQGSQLILHGTYSKPGNGIVEMSGKINGEPVRFQFSVAFESHENGSIHNYVEKIWAGKRIAHLLTMIDQNGKNDEMIDELVQLSKKYGILTPYTSFLAKEDVDITMNGNLIKRSSINLKALEESSGASANEIRSYKNELAKDGGAEDAETVYAYDTFGKKEKVTTVQKIANKTFFFKKKHWVDGEISTDLSNVKEIKKYSKAYFTFVDVHQEAAQYLSMEGDIYIQIDNVVYLIKE